VPREEIRTKVDRREPRRDGDLDNHQHPVGRTVRRTITTARRPRTHLGRRPCILLRSEHTHAAKAPRADQHKHQHRPHIHDGNLCLRITRAHADRTKHDHRKARKQSPRHKRRP
jgi:hypothetical protein